MMLHIARYDLRREVWIDGFIVHGIVPHSFLTEPRYNRMKSIGKTDYLGGTMESLPADAHPFGYASGRLRNRETIFC